LQASTDIIYSAFLFKVSEGRKMDLNKIESIAEGRIWSGLRAKEIGLADFYGGLKDAINYTATIANLGDNWELKPYQSKAGFTRDLIDFFYESPEARETNSGIINKFIKHWKKNIKSLNSFNEPNGLYARMPITFVLN
jgi:protease-4